jgi:hypothetical protein
MPDFVGDNAAQENGDLELGGIYFCPTHGVIVKDACDERNDCKTKDRILKRILGGLRDYSKHDVGRCERPLTRILRN